MHASNETKVAINIDGTVLDGTLERDRAPHTCAAFARLMPFRSRLVHARWSGEAMWVPLGDLEVGVTHENSTSHPAPGQILLYPGGLSETEILVPYGGTAFSSIVGPLAGNHFLTVAGEAGALRQFGERVLWSGALDITIEFA